MQTGAVVNTEHFKKLKQYLVSKVPELSKYIIRASEEYAEVESEYSLISWAVRPYINDLYISNKIEELKMIWDILEELAVNWGESVRNEIFIVTAEEMELYKFNEFIGSSIREHWFEDMAWYPEFRDRVTKMNTHVDKNKYRFRWNEEIEKLGGYSKLDNTAINKIHSLLKEEFKIEKWYPS